MTITDLCGLLEKYSKCPLCGCSEVGNGKGTLDADSGKGYFKRTCACGWSMVIERGKEGKNEDGKGV